MPLSDNELKLLTDIFETVGGINAKMASLPCAQHTQDIKEFRDWKNKIAGVGVFAAKVFAVGTPIIGVVIAFIEWMRPGGN